MFKQILIDMRDHAYHYAKKQNGAEAAKSDYMFKIWAILSFYYVGIVILVAHLVSHFFSFQQARNMPFLVRFVIGVIFAVIPIWLLTKSVINHTKDIPIPEELSKNEYSRKRFISLSLLIIGILFFFSCAILPVYFTGGTIHFGNYVFQRK